MVARSAAATHDQQLVPMELPRPWHHTLGGFSAHAGQSGLVEWAKAVSPRPQRLILTHGEPVARDALRDKLKAEIGVEGERPMMFDTYEL